MTVRFTCVAPAIAATITFASTAGADVAADFNGDGFDDLAIGIPFEHVGGVGDAGAVQVLFGSINGLSSTDNRFFTQGSGPFTETPESSDLFGAAVAAGDFNNDGRDDLVIGVSGEDLSGISGVGMIHVLAGAQSGFSSTSVTFHQNTAGIPDANQTGDAFGSSLAVGDFDGDGFDDLAVGIPNEEVNGHASAGAAIIIYGAPGGLSAVNSQLWHQDLAGMTDSAEDNDIFGYALAAGDFNGNGRDDLAIGVAGEDIVGAADGGAVSVLYGSDSGLSDDLDQLWTQNSSGVLEAGEDGDAFGSALCAGNFDNDRYDDLAIGVFNEDLGALNSAGLVHVLYGTGARLRSTDNQIWHQDSASIGGVAEADDQFGIDMIAGDFDGDGRDDLAIGVPFENYNGGLNDGGGAHVLQGAPTGITSAGDQFFTQNTAGLPDVVESGDSYGRSVTAGDFDGDGFMDLAVGVPGENPNGKIQAGAVSVLYGKTSSGLSGTGAQHFHQDSGGILDTAETTDRFGTALTR